MTVKYQQQYQIVTRAVMEPSYWLDLFLHAKEAHDREPAGPERERWLRWMERCWNRMPVWEQALVSERVARG